MNKHNNDVLPDTDDAEMRREFEAAGRAVERGE